jgi:hypothetical protein
MPFNGQQFMDVFERYNGAVFPMQIVLIVAALVAIQLARKGDSGSGRAAVLILAFFWLWMGVVYHWMFFSEINGLALAFGAFFVLQSALFLYSGVLRDHLTFGPRSGISGFVGTLLIVYALAIYPIIGIAAGHEYPRSPTFGLPCPTTIFTFGLLLRASAHTPLYLLVIPFFWSMLGVSAAFLFGVWEDLGLAIAGCLAVTIFVIDRVQRGPRIRAARLILKEN